MKKLILILLAVFLFSGVTAAQDTLYSETVLNGNLENTWYAEWGGLVVLSIIICMENMATK